MLGRGRNFSGFAAAFLLAAGTLPTAVGQAASAISPPAATNQAPAPVILLRPAGDDDHGAPKLRIPNADAPVPVVAMPANLDAPKAVLARVNPPSTSTPAAASTSIAAAKPAVNSDVKPEPASPTPVSAPLAKAPAPAPPVAQPFAEPVKRDPSKSAFGYLPTLGPSPLRFEAPPPVVTNLALLAVNQTGLPPLAEVLKPFTTDKLTHLELVDGESSGPREYAASSTSASFPLAGPIPGQALVPLPAPAAEPEPVVSPDMLMRYFMRSTNGAAASVSVPIGFTPPPPATPPSSTATYTVGPP
jgi:hypothetical protein